jgi:hypothetical protein
MKARQKADRLVKVQLMILNNSHPIKVMNQSTAAVP